MNFELLSSYEADYPSIPPKVCYFNITPDCNARCLYCTDWTTGRNVAHPGFVEIKRILDMLKSLGVKDISYSGGEPFLRNDILKILEYSKDIGLTSRIITNGSLLQKDQIVQMGGLGIAKIGISIDSLREKTYYSIKGLNLSETLKNLGFLMSAVPPSNISIYVTITRHNILDLVPLADYATSNNIKVQFQPVHFNGTQIANKILNNLWPEEKDILYLDDVIKQLVERKLSGESIGSSVEFLNRIPSFFRKKTNFPKRCFVAYTDVVIDQGLGLRPCWSMSPIDNMRNICDLSEFWISENMRSVRKQIRQKKCPGCLYSCHLNKDYVEWE